MIPFQQKIQHHAVCPKILLMWASAPSDVVLPPLPPLKEWDAKGKVVLPYEHRGDSSVYQAEDFTQYLPPAAGGAGAGDDLLAAAKAPESQTLKIFFSPSAV